MNISIAKQEFLTSSPPSQTVVYSIVSIKCQPGFMWSDGTSIKNISCDANGRWTLIEQCEGILYLSFCFAVHTTIQAS